MITIELAYEVHGMRLSPWIAGSLLFCSLSAAGADEPPKGPGRSKRESWYTYWGLGYGRPSYPSSIQPSVDKVRAVAGVTNLGLSVDLLGFYWPFLGESNSILGVIVSGVSDSFSTTTSSKTSTFQINQYLYSASTMHFFGPQIGEGAFARFDAGAARGVVMQDGAVAGLSSWGAGALLGGGWGAGVSDETRLLFQANLSLRRLDGETFPSISVSVGGLF